jgi:hypothetical protein
VLEHHAQLAKGHARAVLERRLGDLASVDQHAVLAVEIADRRALARDLELGVAARHVGVINHHVDPRRAPERVLPEAELVHEAGSALAVLDQPGDGLGHAAFISLLRFG